MGNYTPEPRVGSDADICSSVLYSHHGFVKHGSFLNSGNKRVWLFSVYCCGHQEISHILYWCTMADPGFPRRRTPTQKCRSNILADFPLKLQKKKNEKIGPGGGVRLVLPPPLDPPTVWRVSYFTGSFCFSHAASIKFIWDMSTQQKFLLRMFYISHHVSSIIFTYHVVIFYYDKLNESPLSIFWCNPLQSRAGN